MIHLPLLLVCLLSVYGWAQNVPGKKIIIKDKDTLWSIAYREYSDGFMWKEIYQLNKDMIKDPNLIFPGDEIILPQREKKYPVELKEITANSAVGTASAPVNSPVQVPPAQTIEKNEPQKDAKKPEVEILNKPVLNEGMPENQVFSSFTNKTILADRDYFNGKVKKILKDDEFEAEGLSEKGDELLLKVSPEKANIGSIAEIYAKIREDDGKITAQLCGRCEIFYVEHSAVKCRLIWVNNFISEDMPVRVK